MGSQIWVIMNGGKEFTGKLVGFDDYVSKYIWEAGRWNYSNRHRHGTGECDGNVRASKVLCMFDMDTSD